MDTQTPYINHWKRLHDSCSSQKAQACKKEVQRVLDISQSAFYRKLSNPQHLSIAEKQAIARVYQLEPNYLFPELEQMANDC